MDNSRETSKPPAISKETNGVRNGDTRSPKFPEDAKYDDVYW